MTAAQPASWFFKAATVFAVSFATCWAIPRAFENIPEFPTISTEREQFLIFDRYFRLPVRKIALAGSSLTARLKEEYFDRNDIRNVALPGGSPLTDLAILADAAWKRPRVIAVETNILSRGVDEEMIREFHGFTGRTDALRPLRTLAALYQRKFGTAPPTLDSAMRANILRLPPAQPLANEKIIAETIVEFDKPQYDDWIRKNAALLKTLADRLEAEGVRVYLFELPVVPEIEQTRFVRTTRMAVSDLFGSDRWLKLDYPAGELRYYDGAHLDERSAILIARALERAILSNMGQSGRQSAQ